MTVELHQIVLPAHDRRAAAEFLAHVLGLHPAPVWGPTVALPLTGGTTIDFVERATFDAHRCTLLVTEAEFETILTRVVAAGLGYFASPGGRRPGEVAELFGGRGFCFATPDGHCFEVLTHTDRPGNSGSASSRSDPPDGRTA